MINTVNLANCIFTVRINLHISGSAYIRKSLIVLGLLVSLGVNAQSPFNRQQDVYNQPYVSSSRASQDLVRVSSTYSSTIYAVGTNEVPSDAYNPSGEVQERSNDSGIRKGFDNPGEYGQSTESPIGEPLVMVVFAALFVAFIAYRRRVVNVK